METEEIVAHIRKHANHKHSYPLIFERWMAGLEKWKPCTPQEALMVWYDDVPIRCKEET